jgi:predicted DNA-binding transcriptional regulator AlpA
MMLSAKDLARELSVSTKTIWRMCDREELPPPVNVGRQFRWKPTDIEAWVDMDGPDRATWDAWHAAGRPDWRAWNAAGRPNRQNWDAFLASGCPDWARWVDAGYPDREAWQKLNGPIRPRAVRADASATVLREGASLSLPCL